jgi:Sushi repeat (SCR repeat)
MNRMKVFMVVVASFAWGAACSSGITDPPVPGGSTKTGGGSGGATRSGGAIGSGGATKFGGAIGSGGTTNSGGTIGSGGRTNSGGATGSGGATNSAGAIGSGGTTSAGGGTSSGGATSSGGTAPVGGIDAGGAPEARDGGSWLDGSGTDGSTNPDAPADMAVGGQGGGPEVGSPADCHTPPALVNGLVSAPVTTFGAVATYSCNLGYSLAGLATRTCQANGTWSGTPPTCVPVACGAPPAIANGSVVAPVVTYGSTATYTCSAGYSFSTATTMRTCQADGTWSTPAPVCAPQTLTLTINKVGTGTVASTPAGITCGAVCQATFAAGTVVSLTATPGANQTFTGWDSTACAGMGTCSFTLTVNTVVRASFSPPPNIMFTTSTTQTPVLGGLSGGDAICATLAANAGLAGTYKAWLSTSTVNAISRLAGASGWVRTDGKPVVNSLVDLAQGRLLYPPRLDELGNDLGADPIVMTGTATDGTVMNTFGSYTTCSDYTSTGALSDMLSTGYASASSNLFTTASSMGCGSRARLYCFGVDRQAQVAVIPAVGRYAFVTQLPWAPGGGIGDADLHCQQDASAAALPGTYKALLAPTGSSAASRFDTSGLPWIRADGIPIAPTAAAFFSTSLFDVPPNVTADGSAYFGPVGVWSGAATPMIAGKGANNCTNWLSSSATAFAAGGEAGDTAVNTFFNLFPADTACGAAFSMHLACLQE